MVVFVLALVNLYNLAVMTVKVLVFFVATAVSSSLRISFTI